MRERALRFGETATLVGILTQPDPEERRRGAPAVVFLNSGILHHVGASRVYVQMARRLAGHGYTSLRFDFSGIGDSEPRRDSLSFEESAIVEAREAMDYLSAVAETSNFVLAGLCSGADMSYFTALQDERVVGVAQLDAFVYRTSGWYLRRYGPKLLSASAWINSVRCRVAPVLDRLRGTAPVVVSEDFAAAEYRRVFPPKRSVKEGMARLAQRGTHLFFCFSGDEDEIAYREQYEESLRSVDFGGRICVQYLPRADHTFTGIYDQVQVVDMVADWFDESFSGYGAESRQPPIIDSIGSTLEARRAGR
jgi:pimeloyl-ACP methyl ester carboxylesterase